MDISPKIIVKYKEPISFDTVVPMGTLIDSRHSTTSFDISQIYSYNIGALENDNEGDKSVTILRGIYDNLQISSINTHDYFVKENNSFVPLYSLNAFLTTSNDKKSIILCVKDQKTLPEGVLTFEVHFDRLS